MEKCKVLFLAANPDATSRLALDEEIREIEDKIRKSDHRDTIQLVSHWAVRPDDLIQQLNQHQPQIVHFSGHGSDAHELILKDDDGSAQTVSKAVLKDLFRVLKDKVRLVVMNACFSKGQAEAIVESIDCAIGMNRPIGDQAAIDFAASFYRAIGFGRSIENAFEQGKLAMRLDSGQAQIARATSFGSARIEETGEHTTPQLLVRAGVDANEIVLVAEAEKPQATPAAPPQPKVVQNVNRGVSIGGNATGNAIITRDNNQAAVHFTQTITNPSPASTSDLDISTEFSALRECLANLDAPDQKKIDRALEDAADEIGEASPDRDEIGTALERAIKYARNAEAFPHITAALNIHLRNVTTWLGTNWQKLLK